MRTKLSKWVIPGILTVLVGTAAIMQFAKAGLEADLGVRAQALLQTENIDWARVKFDGRDANLTGLAASPEQAEIAAELIADLRGVRVVNTSIDQAPTVSPYPFKAEIVGETISLTGGAPDVAARRSLLEKVGLNSSELQLYSGIDDRAQWLEAADFALRQLLQFDNGEVSLSDMTLSMNGRAKSHSAFETVSIVLDAGLPPGVERGEIIIEPPLESPFVWQGDYNGAEIILSGFAPGAQSVESIKNAVPTNRNLVSNIVYASGAPEKFTDNASALVAAFARVEVGNATINDTAINFSATPLTREDADRLKTELAPLNATIELAAPADQTKAEGQNAQKQAETAIGEEQRKQETQVEIEVETPALPLLNELATPPQLPSEEPITEQAGSEEAAIDQEQPQIEIKTPELPNLGALATPPTMPVEPAIEQNLPEQDTQNQVAEPADRAEPQSAAEAEPADMAEGAQAATIVTPPLPNITELSAPPIMPKSVEETPVDAEKPAAVASLPKPELGLDINDDARITLCRDLLTGFESENSILFAPASANLAVESAQSLNRLSVFLKQCPGVEIYVEGHTDSDGPDNSNLALSVARAETVVGELIERGIDAGRLYAVGYGESAPLVPNTTRDGKRQNRRIEFEIVETAE